MTRICLDTSAYSHFKRGDPAAIEALRSARFVGVPAIVLGELRTGFRLGTRRRENERELQEFLAQPVATPLDVDDEAANHYAALVVELRQAGTPIPTNDIWVAALAVREGAVVLTYDAHFELIRRASCWVLPAGQPR